MGVQNEQTTTVDWDHGIYDVMPDIFKYLNITDLCKVTCVSSTWREAALREKAKRNYIQQVRLSYKDPVRSTTLNVIPKVSLLIQDVNNSSFELKDMMYRFTSKEESHVIAFKVNTYHTTEDVERTDRLEQTWSKGYDFHGVFFPSLKKHTSFQVVWDSWQLVTMSPEQRLYYFAENLGMLEDHRPPSILLFFTHARSGFGLAYDFMQNCRDSDNETVWIGTTQESPIRAVHSSENYQYVRPAVALRITGSGVAAWTAEIDTRQPREKFEAELLEFKERVKRRRHCTGLFCSPYNNPYGYSVELTKNVKRIFPGIPIVGLFNSKLWSDATTFLNRPGDLFYQHMNKMSIIIITYD